MKTDNKAKTELEIALELARKYSCKSVTATDGTIYHLNQQDEVGEMPNLPLTQEEIDALVVPEWFEKAGLEGPNEEFL